MKRQAPKNTTGKGCFTVEGSEPLSKKTYNVRVPQSLEPELRELAGDDISGWLRRAIIAQIEKEKSHSTA